uniref:Uncharacterized protein n=1 Tax=Panagrolaimus davidi TaxID=227884 RepID=A0A914PVE4_9BILA
MDSSHPQRISSSNQKRKAQDSIMVACKRAKFMAKYYRQNFSMPDSIIFYIAKNPKTAELYLKMVKTCKYFFIKNEIIVIDNLDTFLGKWRVNGKPLDFTKYNCKYWISDEIRASTGGFVNKNIFLPIIPKLYQCDVKSLSLFYQIISYHDLSLLISSAEKIYLDNVIVKKCDSVIPLEDIVAMAVNAKYIDVIKPTITSKTMKELTKLSHFLKLGYFNLLNLSDVFDIDAFYSYMKKNTHTTFFLKFDEQISDAFKNRLERIIDEILETKQFNYEPPLIRFSGIDIQKYRKLYQIYYSH